MTSLRGVAEKQGVTTASFDTYTQGLAADMSVLDLLDAQRQSYAQQQQLVNVQQQVMNNRIDLYKVLGGGLLEQTGVPSTTATGGSVPVAAPAGSSAIPDPLP